MTNNCWQSNEACPLCGGISANLIGVLPGNGMNFAGLYVQYPDKISLLACKSCGLLYKSIIPTQKLLSKIYGQSETKLWCKWYPYENELALINKLYPGKEIDVIDIGAGRGDTLRALRNKAHVLSAMDVIRQEGIDEVITGEFIHGCIDSLSYKSTGQQYDLVTAFDVIEHFSSAKDAFLNIRSFMRDGGYFIAETGNAKSYWPQRYGAHNWWYVNLLEHTIFWTEESVQSMAEMFGFDVEMIIEKTHKRRNQGGPVRIFRDLGKVAAYLLDPEAYVRYALNKKSISIQPSSPFVKDHFLFLLKKK